MSQLNHVAAFDPDIHVAMQNELHRQQDGLEMIASENFVSQAVLQAAGSVLTNKYAEGPAGKRYYGGCEWVDQVEYLACQRARALYGADYANVQPHSGSQANMAVYMTYLKPNDTILAMDLDAGGHLTHGSPVNFSGQLYHVVHYGVRRDDELIDDAAVQQLAHQHRPKLIVAGASAYSRIIDFPRFAAIAKEVGAKLMVDMAHISGLVAANVHPSPVPHADFVTTTTHKTLRGPRGGMILAKQAYAKDLDKSVCPLIQGGPLMHVIAAKAVAFKEALQPDFVVYAKQVVSNAKTLAKALMQRGFRVVSGGTDNHLILVDLRNKQITGKDAEKALDKAGIAVNKNKVPFDPQKPLVTSGIRLGTAALTTRGMREADMETIAELIERVFGAINDDVRLQQIKKTVTALTQHFPLYHQGYEQVSKTSANM